jgi:hypothetical protein
MKKILINYAAKGTNGATNSPNDGYFQSQKKNTETGLELGGFDVCNNYNSHSLPSDFFEKHKRHFQYTRGAGYWIWKPYIVIDALSKMKDGDFLMYSDSGCYFIDKIDPVIDLIDSSKTGVAACDMPHIEKYWTKRDCFTQMNCDTPEFTDSKQISSSFFFCRKSEFAVHIANEWYRWMSHFNLVTDEFVEPSKFPCYPEFIEHRHDQSILSLVCKLNGVEPIPDIAAFNGEGHPIIEDPSTRLIPQIIYHSRTRH